MIDYSAAIHKGKDLSCSRYKRFPDVRKISTSAGKCAEPQEARAVGGRGLRANLRIVGAAPAVITLDAILRSQFDMEIAEVDKLVRLTPQLIGNHW